MAFPPDSSPYYIGMQNWNNTIHPYPDAPAGPPPPYTPPPPQPGHPVGCPPGLEHLTQVDRLLVQQKVEVSEMVLGWEMANSYVIKNGLGQQLFAAREEGNFVSMQFFGPLRPFNIHIFDNSGRQVLTVSRAVNCGSCCFPCCLQEVEVQSPPGVAIGYVVQNWHPCFPKFTVLSSSRSPQLSIRGPCCDCRCCFSDVVFEVLALGGGQAVVGQISKQWGGLLQEGFTDADNFGISFPMDLDVKVKAVMLAAVFLIDFMFFETNKKNPED